MASANSLRDIDSGYKALADLMRLPNTYITVGVHEKDNDEYPDEEGRAATVAEVATYNEYGTETVPQRSFLRSTFDENRREYEKAIERLWLRAMAGAPRATLVRGMGLLGMRIKRDVTGKIQTLRAPPNAPVTILRKGSSNPLIDSGRMRQAIDYTVSIAGQIIAI